MSTVRDILGVTQPKEAVPSMSAVMASIGMAATAGTKKRKSFTGKQPPKELMNLRDSEGLVKSPLGTPTMGGASESSGTRSKWVWRPFKNSARQARDASIVSHWDNRPDADTKEYNAAKCNISPHMPDLSTGASTDQVHSVLGKYSLSLDSLEYIFDLLNKFDLNFIVAVDRSEIPLSTEQVKDIYYSVYGACVPSLKCKYSVDVDRERKSVLEEKYVTLATEGSERTAELKKQEKELVTKIKEIEANMKALGSDANFIAGAITGTGVGKKPPTPSGKKNGALSGGPALASADPQRISAIDSINKFTLTALPGARKCTSFPSHRINSLVREVVELIEREKQLASFIKRKLAEFKAAKKSATHSQ